MPVTASDPPELEAESFGPYALAAKKRLREKLRALRAALPESRVAERSALICERLLAHPSFANPAGVALFWPILKRREVDLRAVDVALRLRNVPVCYPFMERCKDGSLLTGFRFVNRVEQLTTAGGAFAQPPKSAPVALRGEVDIVVVPALAVTLDGHRLGYGSGFYDATLPDLCPPGKSVVVAFDFQRMVELPTEPHDLRCDFVVTDA